jgi:hypothetical protein
MRAGGGSTALGGIFCVCFRSAIWFDVFPSESIRSLGRSLPGAHLLR